MLPSLSVQTFTTELISTKQKIEMRPFLAKEQKVLLMALETKNPDDVTNAVMNILKSCVMTKNIDVNKLSSFDIQKLFIELRKSSIGEVVELKVRHPQEGHKCEHAQKIAIDLNKVEVSKHEDHTNKIKLTDKIGVVMRYPSPEMLNKYKDKNIQNTFKLIAECIESIFDDEAVYDSFTLEEMGNWIGQLNTEQFQKVTNFFHNQPTLVYNLSYKCDACGEKVEHTLEGLSDFFT